MDRDGKPAGNYLNADHGFLSHCLFERSLGHGVKVGDGASLCILEWSILGMVKVRWRCGTGNRMVSVTNAPKNFTLLYGITWTFSGGEGGVEVILIPSYRA